MKCVSKYGEKHVKKKIRSKKIPVGLTWEGRVIKVMDGSFQAKLESDLHEHFKIFDIEEVHPSSRKQVRPGAVFEWLYEYKDSAGGRSLISNISF